MINKKNSIDAKEILNLIPHRYPFLLVDRIEEIIVNQSCTGIKNVTINEPFFPGHFPGHPIMPGVLIIESMAQTASALVVYGYDGDIEGLSVYLMKVDKAKFRKPVLPGDQLRMEIIKERNKGEVWQFFGKAFVDDKLVAEASITAMVVKLGEK
ncbi:3-hydroxyacyl-ACP dehydratase FabZ [Hyphomicrobiales bacterium]|jgi:3-hydroxyacyl-[acyl-carrier-protein] dehydratase|nr:3-hydroxyacyl-ACP dehydratase FabZ [Hyphomicrobiales bacterium]MDA9034605.1 3-hydroxyacyl-ACP dehydratase FabZ [Hyphomicrobiales bacterium]MDB9925887.1 3-hydroxyacyl-ACP dehydratase FabZ [Hyphomicrobiales bacterium]|tara:strand:+ start:1612 stop:2073 length:462 start_codon:yes stop_codon:yes gene_type:complete